MPEYDPEDLLDRSFLFPKNDDGTKDRAKIVKILRDNEETRKRDPDYIKFKLEVGEDRIEEIRTYNEVLDYISKDDTWDTWEDPKWKFRRIVSHRGPLRKGDQGWKGSSYNLMIEWETGEITEEPLSLMAEDSFVVCARYARDNNLLDTPGFKRFKKAARRVQVLEQLLTKPNSLHTVVNHSICMVF